LQVSLRSRRAEKERTIKRVISLKKKYVTMAISRIHKVRASQLMELRRKFRKNMEITVVKNKIASIALRQAGMNEKFTDELRGQSALLFTNMDPFKLYLLLEKNKVNLPARPGDVATEDITIPAGNTGIPPGPVLSEFKEVKVPTRIDSGSIWVSKDTVVVGKGDVISPKLASLLSRLGMRPIRAGLSVSAAFSDGLIFHDKDIMLDLNEYQSYIKEAFLNAKALAIGAFYPTKEILPLIISRYEHEARTLAVVLGYLSKDVMVEILARHKQEAIILHSKIKEKGY
jgi:large subunit ribosomal protein L10